MSLNIKTGATPAAVTGGTDETYVHVPNSEAGNTFVNSDEADAAVRDSVNLRSRIGKLGTSVIKDKRVLRTTIPVEDATTGEVRYNTLRIELAIDPRDVATMVPEMLGRAADIVQRTVFANFWLYGTEE